MVKYKNKKIINLLKKYLYLKKKVILNIGRIGINKNNFYYAYFLRDINKNRKK